MRQKRSAVLGPLGFHGQWPATGFLVKPDLLPLFFMLQHKVASQKAVVQVTAPHRRVRWGGVGCDLSKT